jgi:hypothetical protein
LQCKVTSGRNGKREEIMPQQPRSATESELALVGYLILAVAAVGVVYCVYLLYYHRDMFLPALGAGLGAVLYAVGLHKVRNGAKFGTPAVTSVGIVFFILLFGWLYFTVR